MGNCLNKEQSSGGESNHKVELAGGNVQLITTKERWDEKISEASKDGKIVYMTKHSLETPFYYQLELLMVVNFSASWCGPCRMIAPFYCELSEKYPSLIFLTVDVDELAEFSSSWEIGATPTFFFLKDGQQLDKLVGANKPELQKKITTIADSVTQCQN